MDEVRTISIEEFNRLWENSQKYHSACTLIADLLDCGSRDADEILRLVDLHDSDIIDSSREFAEGCGLSQNFGTIIEGVKNVVFWKLRAILEEEEFLEADLELFDEWINELIIDDNYIAWGCVASYGSCPEEVGNYFAEIMSRGFTDKHNVAFFKAFKEALNGERV